MHHEIQQYLTKHESNGMNTTHIYHDAERMHFLGTLNEYERETLHVMKHSRLMCEGDVR